MSQMKVLIAGATGAIGRPLLRCLREAGHEPVALVGSSRDLGRFADQVEADVLDAESVAKAVRQVRPEIIVNELTSLPRHYTPEEMRAAAPRDKDLRRKGNANLLAAARQTRCRRYLLQSCAFWYAPGPGLADETAAFALDASPGVAAGCATYASLESAALESRLETVFLRYGFFYGPGTWFSPEGDVSDQVRRHEMPVIGGGEGIWNWVHIDDAAAATSAALGAAPGAYNIVGDEPPAQSVWLPAFARFVGAPEPRVVSKDQAMRDFGPDAVYYATELRGASNERAKSQLAFRTRPLEWIHRQGSAGG
jgi:nucleoside-diphosphate-sugar epimerase